MNDSRSRSSVVKVIKNHVIGCGGDIPLSALIEDYNQSYGCDIPFSKFGYNSLVDFLFSITSLSVKICEGEYHVRTLWLKNADSNKSAHSESPSEMPELCVEMNNLIVSDSAAKRKVTVKGAPYETMRNRSLERYYSHSIRNEDYVPSSGYSSENYSVANSSFDYDTSFSPGNDYNSIRPDEYFSFADQDVYSSATNYGYDGQWPPTYQSSFDDSSLIYQNGWTNPNSTFDYDLHDPQHFSSANYNGLFSSPDVPKSTAIGFKSPPVTEEQVVKRIVSLVNAHRKKVTSSEVEFLYQDSYSDALPKNWLTLLEESNPLFFEHFTSGTVFYPNRTFSTIPTTSDLPQLDLPRQMPWSVSIVAIRSVDSIWFRLNENDLSRRYQILSQQMKKHYKNTSPGDILSVEVHQLFVARFKNKLMRVRVVDRQENGTCKCFAIDEGITEIFSLSTLMMLDEKFTNTPKLICKGFLAGLNKYTECSHIRERLDKMVVGADASVVVEKSEGGTFSINLFVTKPNGSDSVNVNEYLQDVIKTELNLPKLKISRIFDVVILSLSLDDNVAKVQIKSQCLELLQESLQKCRRIIDCTDKRLLFAKNLVDVQLNQLYLAKYSDGSWQRVLLKQFIDSTHVVVVFVDFQDIQALDIKQIICYAHFPDALTYIPPQAVTVNIVKTNYEVLKLMKVRLKTNLFSMKIVQTDPKLYVQMYMKAPLEICAEDISNANSKQFCCSAV